MIYCLEKVDWRLFFEAENEGTYSRAIRRDVNLGFGLKSAIQQEGETSVEHLSDQNYCLT